VSSEISAQLSRKEEKKNKQKMGGFDDFLTGFKQPFEFVYDHGVKPGLGLLDKATGTAGKLLDAGGNVATGLGDLLSGNSNILLYIGLGIVGVVVLPVLLDKFL